MPAHGCWNDPPGPIFNKSRFTGILKIVSHCTFSCKLLLQYSGQLAPLGAGNMDPSAGNTDPPGCGNCGKLPVAP